MVLGFLLFCAFLFGIGCISVPIELRTRMGPLYQFFAVSVVFVPALAFFDVLSFWPDLEVQTRIHLQRLLHLTALLYIPTALHLVLKITGRRLPLLIKTFAVLCGLNALLVLIPGHLRWEGPSPSGGPLYAWTFLPLGSAFVVLFIYYTMSHWLTVPSGQKRFAISVFSFVFVALGGVADMVAMAFPETRIFPSFKSIGMIVFGSICAYFFSEQFFTVIQERGRLFKRIETLVTDLDRLRPLGKIGEGASFISHEIKNYASLLRSNNLLLKSKLPESEVPEMERITRSTERLEQFARSILDYSREPEGARKQPVSLRELLVDLVQLQFANSKLAVHSDCPCPGTIEGHPLRLERAFANLLRNSLEAGATEWRYPFAKWAAP